MPQHFGDSGNPQLIGPFQPIKLFFLFLIICALAINARGSNAGRAEARILDQSKAQSLQNDQVAIIPSNRHDQIFHQMAPRPLGRFDSKTLTIEKTVPDVQLGLASTVPFLSVKSDNLIPQPNKKLFDVQQRDGLSLGSLFSFKFAGFIIAAIIGVILILVIPAHLGVQFPPSNYGGILIPSYLQQFMPAFVSGQYGGQYNSYQAGIAPGTNNGVNYGRQYDTGLKKEGRKRSLTGGSENGTVSQIISTVNATFQSYWNQCGDYVTCLMDSQSGRELDGRSNSSRRTQDEFMEAVDGFGHKVKVQLFLMEQLYKSFQTGQVNSECSLHFKQCPLPTVAGIDQTIENFGNYIFN